MIQEEEQYNADDEKKIEKARKREAKKKYERDEAIRNLMSTKGGRAWVHHILDFGDMFGNPIVRGDPYDTYNNLGMANLAKMIWSEVEDVAPESCLLMRKEAKENEKLPSE